MAVGDWVPMVRYGTQTSASLNPAFTEATLNFILCSTGDDLGLVAEVGIVETQNAVLAKRVVGGVLFRAALANTNSTVIIHERIRVGLLNADGDPSFFATDMNAADDANEPFLWERVSQIFMLAEEVYTWPQADVGDPRWSLIDCRVARRLERSEALFYSLSFTRYEAGGFDVTDLFTVTPYLRTWARALG